jgi:heme-degrading monooxygenase HmoA
MVTEIAQIEIKPGHEAAFEAAVAEAAPLFQRAKGCTAMRLERSVENPLRYRLVVAWATLENHMVDFREAADFQEWRRLAGPHFASPPVVEHTEIVVAGFGQ